MPSPNRRSVLLLGGGGREHAIAWRLTNANSADGVADSSGAERPQKLKPMAPPITVFVAPGNAGTEQLPDCVNVNLDHSNHEKVVEFCKEKNIDLVVVGPEAPLATGLCVCVCVSVCLSICLVGFSFFQIVEV